MISVVILTKNEELMIENCINSCRQVADEIIVIDNMSNDRTIEIANSKNAHVVTSSEPGFDTRRNIGLEKAKGEWILYIDADERVTKELAEEILRVVKNGSKYSGFIINRKDYYFGELRPVYSPMHRFFKKSDIQKWQGSLHESPLVTGDIGTLDNYLIHFTHIDIDSMLRNTLNWSSKEARLRFEQDHPQIVWWRLIRVFITGFWGSFVTQKGYMCGTAGWVEALYQGSSLFLTYAKVWELQNEERIKKSYEELDKPFTS